MKKIITVLTLLCFIVLSWCGISKKVDTSLDSSTWVVKTNSADNTIKWKYVFEDTNCQSYVALMECLIDKTPDAAKKQTISSFEKVMELWKGLDKSALPSTCKNTVDMLQNQKDVFTKAGCDLK